MSAPSTYVYVRQERHGRRGERFYIGRFTTPQRYVTIVAEVNTEHAARTMVDRLNRPDATVMRAAE